MRRAENSHEFRRGLFLLGRKVLLLVIQQLFILSSGWTHMTTRQKPEKRRQKKKVVISVGYSLAVLCTLENSVRKGESRSKDPLEDTLATGFPRVSVRNLCKGRISTTRTIVRSFFILVRQGRVCIFFFALLCIRESEEHHHNTKIEFDDAGE